MSFRRLFTLLLPRTIRDWLRPREELIGMNLRWRWRRLFHRPPYPVNPDGKVCLHLGCGPIDHPGFINVDAIGFRHVHHLSPVFPLPAFPSEWADLVYVSHCLEHLCIDDVPRVLKEWRRVLKPGGKLRLAVPDFEAVLRVYEESGRDLRSVQYVLMGGQNYPFNFHMAVFDRRHLTALLEAAGFENVTGWEPGQDAWTPAGDCASANCRLGEREFPVSLNVEARRAVV